MAEKITRKQALVKAINYSKGCGDYATAEILEKMLDQLSKPRKATVSKARLMNENLARALAEKANGEITTKDAVAFGIPEIGTTQKAAAVLRVATELGLFEKVAEGKKVAYKKVIEE